MFYSMLSFFKYFMISDCQKCKSRCWNLNLFQNNLYEKAPLGKLVNGNRRSGMLATTQVNTLIFFTDGWKFSFEFNFTMQCISIH